MGDASRRAAAKPARGGVENALFVQASVETLPGVLVGSANRITVNYPWGSLLRAVALPDAAPLSNLRALAAAGAELDVLINMQPLRDAALAAKLGLADVAIAADHARLRGVYVAAGWSVRAVEDVTGSLIRATRWGSQLHHAKREVVRVRAIKSSKPGYDAT